MFLVLMLLMFVFFIIGGYISQRYKSLVDLPLVVLWPAFLAGLIGKAIWAKEAQRMARKLKQKR